MSELRLRLRDHLNSFRTIFWGFVLLILAGAFLLSLPSATMDHTRVPFLNALFTSTSAACVTGLVVYDTATQWSIFGRTVILVLIQIGGLGVVTFTILTLMLTGKKIGIMQRVTMQDAISAPQIGGIVRFTKFFLIGTAVMEGLGALALYPVFAREFGAVNGIGYAIFHSVSAFCNAGFDILGKGRPFTSLTTYIAHPGVNLTVILLIVIGGIGFLTWSDLLQNRFRFRTLRLQTKVVLTTTAVLLLIPFLFFFFKEFADMEIGQRFLASLFQAVTPRTAGFNTFDYSKMSESGLLMTIVLMIIGGAPGSTAGGMKVTTIAIVLLAAKAFLTRKSNVNCFKRRIDAPVIHNALTLLIVYTMLLLLGTIVLAECENLPVIQTMFECASALGTVGLTTGITPGLCDVSKVILILFMFFGRVGGVTLAYAVVSSLKKDVSKYPVEKITVG